MVRFDKDAKDAEDEGSYWDTSPSGELVLKGAESTRSEGDVLWPAVNG